MALATPAIVVVCEMNCCIKIWPSSLRSLLDHQKNSTICTHTCSTYNEVQHQMLCHACTHCDINLAHGLEVAQHSSMLTFFITQHSCIFHYKLYYATLVYVHVRWSHPDTFIQHNAWLTTKILSEYTICTTHTGSKHTAFHVFCL